nr:hypothetical protein [Nocardia abscessus]
MSAQDVAEFAAHGGGQRRPRVRSWGKGAVGRLFEGWIECRENVVDQSTVGSSIVAASEGGRCRWPPEARRHYVGCVFGSSDIGVVDRRRNELLVCESVTEQSGLLMARTVETAASLRAHVLVAVVGR